MTLLDDYKHAVAFILLFGFFVPVACAESPATALPSQLKAPERLATVFWDASHLASVKAELSRDDDAYKSEVKRLKRAAKESRRRTPHSVMDKDESPPSGDKHDYMSFSRYWWPDPDKADGLPYIRHDGKVNRKLVDRGDRNRIGDLMDDVVPLALASYLLDDEDAGKQATQLLRVWFLDDATRMNPHLNFAQAVPGRADGRGVGIIDTRGFIWLLDAVALLDASGAMTAEDRDGLESWFSEFLNWLQTSSIAKSERTAENNHGSWYAAQVCRIALFVDRPELVQSVATDVKERRIPDQIADDGSQPYELERTQSEHYSLFNLAALTVVARAGEHVDVNIWDSKMKKAVDYLAKYADGDDEWPHPQMKGVQLSLSEVAALTLMANRYGDSSTRRLLKSKRVKDGDLNFTKLQFPLVGE